MTVILVVCGAVVFSVVLKWILGKIEEIAPKVIGKITKKSAE